MSIASFRHAANPLPGVALPGEVADVIGRVARARAALNEEIRAGLQQLSAKGEWGQAIRLVLEGANVTEAELAQALGTNRSTVHRWRTDESIPPVRSIPTIVDMIEDYLKRSIPR
jgi:hypothetical protein